MPSGKASKSPKITTADCQKLAELYRAESKSKLSRAKKAAERRAFEDSLGITPWLNLKIYLGDFGICTGTTLYSIPEEGANKVSYIGSGNAVIIKEKTGRWVFVKFGETEGWAKKDEVIVWTWETF